MYKVQLGEDPDSPEDPAEVAFPPVVGGGIAYVGLDEGNLFALDAVSGRLLWTREIELYAPPAVHDGVVYAGSPDGILYALDAASGESRWRYTTDSKISFSPVVAGNMVYVISHDGYVHAISTGR